MAGPVNMIGEHKFLRIEGALEALKTQTETQQRRGVDGVSIWDTGKRGVPIRLRAQVDVDDRNAGQEELEKYTRLIGKNPVNITWNDFPFEGQNVKFAILNVTRASRGGNVNIKTAVGGLSDNAGALVTSIWTVIPVTPEDEG